MEKDQLDFSRDVQIDPDSLDVEWLQQPDLILAYSLAQDDAGKERDDAKRAMEKAKDKLTEIKAEVSLDARTNPDDYDLPKVTDSSVNAAVELDDRVKEAKRSYYKKCEEFDEAKHNFNTLYSAVRALQDKKESLENLVRLLGMTYFAAPNVERNLAKEASAYRHKRTASTKKKAREKIKGRRTKK